MNITKPKEVVINAWKTFKTRDARLIAELFASDAEWIAPAGNATAVALKHTDHMIGPDQIANFIASEMHHLFSNVTSRFAAYMPTAILWCSRSRCEPLFRAASPMRMTIASSLSWPATASSRCANTWTHGLADDFRGRLKTASGPKQTSPFTPFRIASAPAAPETPLAVCTPPRFRSTHLSCADRLSTQLAVVPPLQVSGARSSGRMLAAFGGNAFS